MPELTTDEMIAAVREKFPDAHWVPRSGHIYRSQGMSSREAQFEDYESGPLATNVDEDAAWKSAWQTHCAPDVSVPSTDAGDAKVSRLTAEDAELLHEAINSIQARCHDAAEAQIRKILSSATIAGKDGQ